MHKIQFYFLSDSNSINLNNYDMHDVSNQNKNVPKKKLLSQIFTSFEYKKTPKPPPAPQSQPKSNYQAQVYNFLERPTGWKCFIYHFLV